MKKFFSLFVMLMVATMTFATDYSDVLNYTIYGYSDKINPSNVSITDEGDDLYTIVLKDVDVTPVLGTTLGDLTIEMVEGKTENGVTTITSDGCPIVSSAFISDPTNVTLSELTVKFDDKKAYIHIKGLIIGSFDYEISYGTDNFGTSTAVKGISYANGYDSKQIYNLSGMKVGTMRKGRIYIMNGKKIIK